jgi:hypothetical protein
MSALYAYRVTVTQLVPDDALEKPDDRVNNPAGSYDYEARDAEHALDQFHSSVPVGCLEDFAIEATRADGAVEESTAMAAALKSCREYLYGCFHLGPDYELALDLIKEIDGLLGPDPEIDTAELELGVTRFVDDWTSKPTEP